MSEMASTDSHNKHKVYDLMDALEKSLEAAKKERGRKKMDNRCEAVVEIGGQETTCQRLEAHRGSHQADIKAKQVFGEVATDCVATVSW